MVSTGTLDTEIGVVIAAIFAVLVAVYLLYRYLRRRGPELAARESKSVLDDRSYNQIRIGQAAADRLAQTGIDVTAAKELFRRAETARASGNYETSIELSKRGQDVLAAARSGGNGMAGSLPTVTLSSVAVPRPAAGGALRSSTAPGYTAPPAAPVIAGDTARAPEVGAPLEPATDRPPKNKMEAHFQLSVVQDELDQARSTKSRTKAFQDADSLRKQGQAAYDKQDFTEALRLALKSRRTLGTRVEALPVSVVPASATTPGGPVNAGTGAKNSGGVASPGASGPNCSQCGRTAAATDQFCRSCGAPITPAMCTNCGAPLVAGDRFCGKCGATQA